VTRVLPVPFEVAEKAVSNRRLRLDNLHDQHIHVLYTNLLSINIKSHLVLLDVKLDALPARRITLCLSLLQKALNTFAVLSANSNLLDKL